MKIQKASHTQGLASTKTMHCILLKGKLLSIFHWRAVMSKTYNLEHEYTSIHLILYLWFLGWRLVLLAHFMNSECHLYSKISKQWLFIRCTKKMLEFYRNCWIHFTEVTGRAQISFFWSTYVMYFEQQRGELGDSQRFLAALTVLWFCGLVVLCINYWLRKVLLSSDVSF